MNVLHRLSLRIKLAALVAVGSLVVLPVGALALYRDLSSEVSDAITTELEVRLSDIEGSYESVSIPASHSVLAQVVDARGKVLAPAGAAALLTDRELADALEHDLLADRAVAGIGGHGRVFARRLRDAGSEPVVGAAATNTEPLRRARRRLVLVLAVTGPVLSAVITAAAWWLTGAALRPVRRMARKAATISMAQPGRRLPQPGGRDEIAELGRTLNRMLERIESTVAHERAFIDDASHELRSPIAVLRGELELAAGDPGDAEAVARGLRSALEETDRLIALAEDLLTLARADAGQLHTGTGRTELLEAARTAAWRVPAREGVAVETQGIPVDVCADRDWIQQIVTNLVANATRHARTRVLLEVSAGAGDAHLVVSDDGAGFPERLLPQVFDRFVRGDVSRAPGGTGLGLAIVASLARAAGGDVQAGNGAPLGGARVDVSFPRAGS